MSAWRIPLPCREDEFRSRGGNHEICRLRGSKTSSGSRVSCSGPLDGGVKFIEAEHIDTVNLIIAFT